MRPDQREVDATLACRTVEPANAPHKL